MHLDQYQSPRQADFLDGPTVVSDIAIFTSKCLSNGDNIPGHRCCTHVLSIRTVRVLSTGLALPRVVDDGCSDLYRSTRMSEVKWDVDSILPDHLSQTDLV